MKPLSATYPGKKMLLVPLVKTDAYKHSLHGYLFASARFYQTSYSSFQKQCIGPS